MEENSVSPVVSILMSIYKEPFGWISNSIDSVLAQTYKMFELIIVDDNPEDKDLIRLLEDYEKKDSRIKIIYNEINLGLTKSLNKAYRHIQGDYIARLDADDAWVPNKLQLQIEFMNCYDDVVLCGSWASIIDEKGNVRTKTYELPQSDCAIGKAFLTYNPIIHSSVLIRVSSLNLSENSLYDENYTSSQDYALWSKMFASGGVMVNIPLSLVLYRRSPNQISEKKKDQQSENARRIRCEYLKFLFSVIGVSNVESLSCDALSEELRNKEVGKHLRPVCYQYLLMRYADKYQGFTKTFQSLLKNGDITRFKLRETIHLLLGHYSV